MKNNSKSKRQTNPNYELFQLDAISLLKSLDSDSIDLIITDPPYESLEKHRAIGTTTRLKNSKSSSNSWFTIFPNRRFPELFNEIYRVLKKNTHFYLFCDQETAFIIKPYAETSGFKFWKPLVWDKKAIGMGYHYRSRYEFILFFEKGKRKLNSLSIPDILEAKRIYRGYPTEKPVELSEILIEQSSKENDIVCDPFMGAGSVGRAAIRGSTPFPRTVVKRLKTPDHASQAAVSCAGCENALYNGTGRLWRYPVSGNACDGSALV